MLINNFKSMSFGYTDVNITCTKLNLETKLYVVIHFIHTKLEFVKIFFLTIRNKHYMLFYILIKTIKKYINSKIVKVTDLLYFLFYF